MVYSIIVNDAYINPILRDYLANNFTLFLNLKKKKVLIFLFLIHTNQIVLELNKFSNKHFIKQLKCNNDVVRKESLAFYLILY